MGAKIQRKNDFNVFFFFFNTLTYTLGHGEQEGAEPFAWRSAVRSARSATVTAVAFCGSRHDSTQCGKSAQKKRSMRLTAGEYRKQCAAMIAKQKQLCSLLLVVVARLFFTADGRRISASVFCSHRPPGVIKKQRRYCNYPATKQRVDAVTRAHFQSAHGTAAPLPYTLANG